MKGRIVYVVDVWDELAQESYVSVFGQKVDAERALKKLISKPGDWYSAVVRRKVR